MAHQDCKTAKDRDGKTIRVGNSVEIWNIYSKKWTGRVVKVTRIHKQGADGTILTCNPVPDPEYKHHNTHGARDTRRVATKPPPDPFMVPVPKRGPDVDAYLTKLKESKKVAHVSATIEPCYCGEEDHRQIELYLLDIPDRLTAQFAGITFHLSAEEAETKAADINRRSHLGKKSPSTKTRAGTNKEKTMKTKTKKTQKPGEPSNKAIIYLAFKKGVTDRVKLLKLVKNAVKESTVRSWLASWKRKDNLPAIAKA